MIGSAVCHRAPSHSFSIAGRQLPLCARCSGTFLGALVGFFGQAVVLRRRRAANFPPAPIIAILAAFTLLWAVDGLNSYLSILSNGPNAYQPQNWLRLVTGALNGLTMSALVYPTFNLTLWQRPADERTIRGSGDLCVLLLLEAALVGLVLSRWPFLLYPLALLSALGVLALLVSVNGMLALILAQQENAAESWHQAVVPLLAGLTLSLIQIGAIDAVRYLLTGTLKGF